MKRIITTALLICSGLWSTNPARAHDGDHPPDMRIWKDAEGLFEIEGSFLTLQDQRVKILKHDGSTVIVPLEKLSEPDRDWVRQRQEMIQRLNGVLPISDSPVTPVSVPSQATYGIAALVGLALLAAGWRWLTRVRMVTMAAIVVIPGMIGLLTAAPQAKPSIQTHFEPFKDKIKFRSDEKWFYVESNGMPDHPMMIGITAWQQQVPIPQAYTGRNAWQIPLVPKFADNPVSAKKELFRGAIALAVNGVPIFNPIKNDGRTDTFLAGELDEYGGHCGRADDYHYHIAPIHLQKIVGEGNPIAYALDGFPIYGYTDANGQVPKNLDEFNGRMEKDGYRYYSTKTYPYINGGMRGEVTVRDDQIDPQPRAYSPRPALTPLRGAKITGFERDDAKKTVTVKYEQNGKPGSVKYTSTGDSYQFTFKDANGRETTETYRIRDDGRRPPPKKDGPPKKDDRPPPPKKEALPQTKEEAPTPKPANGFTLSSPAFDQRGKMPAEFTGDGDGISPPLSWSGAPKGTKCYALTLWHKPMPNGDEVKSYWVIANIPANATSLMKGSKDIGTAGLNDKRRTGYDPMNSKGPGPKEYHITLYALSEELNLEKGKFNRADLLKAIQNITLGEATLSYTYERKAK